MPASRQSLRRLAPSTRPIRAQWPGRADEGPLTAQPQATAALGDPIGSRRQDLGHWRPGGHGGVLTSTALREVKS